ncbi:MAG TPA: hypothetical protein VGJ20_25425 [Xanthobacteraceae bacterium]|jgi:hypothetical protein
MTDTLKIAAIATVVALSIPSVVLAQSRSMYNSTDVGLRSHWSIYRPGPQQDPNDAWDGYFANRQDNPNYHGSNGG